MRTATARETRHFNAASESLYPKLMERGMAYATREMARDDAYDVVQGVAIEICTLPDTTHPLFSDDAALDAYLKRAIRSRIVDNRRSRAARSRAFVQLAHESSSPPEWMDPELSAEREELRRDIEAAIAALPPRCQLAFRKVYSGMTYQEVATELGLSVGTVNKHVAHAYKLLRTALSAHRPVQGRSRREETPPDGATPAGAKTRRAPWHATSSPSPTTWRGSSQTTMRSKSTTVDGFQGE